jgi:hypothetical protein
MRRFISLLFCLHCPLQLPAQGPSFYPNFQTTLQLTTTQWSNILQLRDDHQAYLSSKYERLSQVNQEINLEKLRPEPDPNQLGLRFYEIAAICQESTNRSSAHKLNLRNLLTPQQAATLQQLETSLKLLPTLGEAQELQFLSPESTPFSWGISRFSATASLPGCPGNNSGVFAIISRPADSYPNLIRHLQLSEAQLEQILAANNRLQQELAESYIAAQQLQLEMEAESALPRPRPSFLGDKALGLEQICRTSIALEAGLQQSLPQILNPAQRARLAEIEQALRLLPALAESQNINLSPRLVEGAAPPFPLSLSPARRIEWQSFASAGPNLPGCQNQSNSSRWFDSPRFQP